MNSEILNYLGLGNIDPAIFFLVLIGIILILIILLIVQIVKCGKLSKRINEFIKGKDCDSLEDQITELFEDNKYIIGNSEANKKGISEIKVSLQRSLRKIGIIKYDAFNQMGGKLSFALAVLDENDNGFILNSVHSADGCYQYIKVIKRGESELDLGDEEREALNDAISSR